MDLAIRERFNLLWRKYFNNAELPLTFYYTNEEGHAKLVKPGSVPQCVIGALIKVRRGNPLCFNVDSIGCRGGKRYFGFSTETSPDFAYFISYGIPGKLEGERYKKTPQLVKDMAKSLPTFKAPLPLIVFKRWDMLEKTDEPKVVAFFAQPDVLSGLYVLAHFDEVDQNPVIAPASSGCASIVQYPYIESRSECPRPIMGMFDISARPYVPTNLLTFSVPMPKFIRMVDNMEESFLITKTWRKIQKRIP